MNGNISALRELLLKVKAMREAQKAYFKARRANPHTACTDEMDLSRRLEREVDCIVKETLALADQAEETPSLFGEGG